MRVLFAVEAGFKAGLGHLLRCRALLLELKARGHTVDLWLHGDDSSLAGRIWPAEMQISRSDGNDPIGTACDGIGEQLNHNHYDWLVVDGYSFSGHALCEQLAAHNANLLMIDDLGDRALKADIILNQNSAHADVYENSSVVASSFLLGPQYALIDDVYAKARPAVPAHEKLARVLISFGGVDRHGRTIRVVDLLSRHAGTLDIVVVVGPYFPRLAELDGRCGNNSLRVVQNVSNLAELMRQCDLMVTAAGSTVWQACCVGVPMLVLQTVDNQSLLVKTMREFEAALCLDVSENPGKDAGILDEDFFEIFQKIQATELRARISNNAMQLVDGNGARRVASALESWNKRNCEKR